MKTPYNRLLSLLLALVMCLSLVPLSAFAEEVEEEIAVEEPAQTAPAEEAAAPEELPEQPAPTEEPKEAEEPTVTEEPDAPVSTEEPAPTEEPESEDDSEDPLPSEEPAEPEEEELPEEELTDEEPEEPQAVCVAFVCEPEELTLTVWERSVKELIDAYDEAETEEEIAALDVELSESGLVLEPIAPEADGTYLLLPGEYIYRAECEGYETAEELFYVESEPLTVDVVLTAENAERLLLEGTVASGKCGDDLKWTLDSSGVLTISGKGDMDNFDNYDIEAPWKSYSSNIKSVSIGSGVTGIGDYAFYGCTALTKVTIPGTVTRIGDSAFSSCYALTSVTIPKSVKSIGDYAFSACFQLKSVTISSGVTSIGQMAFYACANLTSITIPSGVTSIGDGAFVLCKKLTTISIPDSITFIPLSMFDGCYSLKTIKVGSNNKKYSTVNGVLFNKDKTMLLRVPGGVTGSYSIPKSVVIGNGAFLDCQKLTDVTIPDTVTGIPAGAFRGCGALKSVIIPNRVKSVGNNAFDYCRSLRSVTLPASVKSIGSYAFLDCEDLHIYYEGTAEQRSKISIAEDNDELISATWHYNSSAYNYTITFNANKGSGTMSKLTGNTSSNAYLTKNKYTRTGHEFTGWNTKADGSGKSYGDGVIIRDIITADKQSVTLYAQWQVNLYHIDYCTEECGQIKTHGESIKLIADIPPKTGYTFQGWAISEADANKGTVKYKPGAVYSGNADLRLYAVWKVDTYKITYNANGGSGSITDQSRKYTDAFLKLSSKTPTRTGYTFLGWSEDESAASASYKPGQEYSQNKSATLYAVWKENTYTLEFYTDALFPSLIESVTLRYSQTYQISDYEYTKDYQHVSEWKERGLLKKNKKTVKYAQNISKLTAVDGEVFEFTPSKYVPNTYDFIYESSKHGAQFLHQTVTYGKGFTLKSATTFKATGYNLVKWKFGDDSTWAPGAKFANMEALCGKGGVPEENNAALRVHAVWEPIKYTVTYKTNLPSGVGAPSNSNPAQYTIEDTVTFKALSKEGYDFIGLFSDSGYKKPIADIPEGTTGNKTVYAKFTPHKYTIKFDGGKGTLANSKKPMPDLSVKYDEQKALTSFSSYYKAPAGYTFTGWICSLDGKPYVNAVKIKNLTAEDGAVVTMTAQYEPISYTVVFNAGGNKEYTAPASITCTYDQEITLPEFTQKTGNGYLAVWQNKSDTKEYKPGTTVKNLMNKKGTVTLTAVWSEFSENNEEYIEYRKKIDALPKDINKVASTGEQFCRVDANGKHKGGLCTVGAMETLCNRLLYINGVDPSDFFDHMSYFLAEGFTVKGDGIKEIKCKKDGRAGFYWGTTKDPDRAYTQKGVTVKHKASGMLLKAEHINSNSKNIIDDRKITELLREHPEGIMLHSKYFDVSGEHGIVITDYKIVNGKVQYYVIDPMNVLDGKNRIPVESSYSATGDYRIFKKGAFQKNADIAVLSVAP